jgi:hypothetical protein
MNTADPLQSLLVNWYLKVKQIAAIDPKLASAAETICKGIKEMQRVAIITPHPLITAVRNSQKLQKIIDALPDEENQEFGD